MSLLYKDPQNFKYTVDIEQNDGEVNMVFWSDSGKFGTDEIVDEYHFTPKELLEVLQTESNKDVELDDETPLLSKEEKITFAVILAAIIIGWYCNVILSNYLDKQ
ncbi:hypothetical protein [Nonlabens agnitus]|uniref:Uncharacterized protein n=1 Tax=Nonlabens agnitus TaxID=870484 RepID=A0A2S9WXC9_9FLAO|nr:hypothetical protein [Nonlabens agnitus]PRP68128.1 hypothetical protein BST86_14035 [Nonlabens agnitus]